MGLFKNNKTSAVFTEKDSRKTLHKNLEFTAIEQYKILRTNLDFTLPEDVKGPCAVTRISCGKSFGGHVQRTRRGTCQNSTGRYHGEKHH